MADTPIVQGMDDIIGRLKLLEDHIKRRMLVDIMRKSMQTMLREAEARAPIGPAIERTHKKSKARFTNIPGYLKKSFRIKKMRSDNPFLLEVQLQNTAYYALWVERGHKLVRGKGRNKRVVGHASPHPFMRPTYDSQKEAVIAQVVNGIKAGLTRRGV